METRVAVMSIIVENGEMVELLNSILDPEPKYGLAVTGFVHPDKVLTNSGAKPGDVLLFTKPLGIGILTTAAKADLASEEGLALAYKMMTTLNKAARDAMVKYNVHACTDVTGFGLLGHTYEMAEGSDVEITLNVDAIDLIPEALEFARMAFCPPVCTGTGNMQNLAWTQVIRNLPSRTCSTSPSPPAVC